MRTSYGQFVNCPYFVPTTNLYAIVKEQYYRFEIRGLRFEVLSSSLASRSSRLSFGGGERVRTDDPLRARQVLSQLSYTPDKPIMKVEG